MKTESSKSLLNTIRGGRLICIVLALTALSLGSCKNFLNGNQVKQEIEDAIAYNNAKVVNVNLVCQSQMGKIFPSSTYQARLDFEFEVQFIPNTNDYVIKDSAKIFEAVSMKDPSVSRADCVEFKAIPQTEQDKSEGLYRAKVKVIKNADDLQIQPACLLIPAISSYEPASTMTTSYANTPIVIKFNMPMEATDLPSAQSLFTLKTETQEDGNILLSYGKEPVSQYFETPYFNAEKTELTIEPKGAELRDYILSKNTGSVLIDVSFSERIKVVNEDIELSLKNTGIAFSVNYTPVVETDAPVQYDFFATRYKMTLASAGTIAAEQKFNFEDLSSKGSRTFDDYKDLVFQNASNGIIYIYGRFYDEGSGVKNVVVTDRRSQNQNMNFVGDKETVTVYTKDSDTVQFVTNNNETVFCIMHKLDNGKTGEDTRGAYLVNVDVQDACNNSTKAYNPVDITKKQTTITVIKKDGWYQYGTYGSGISLYDYSIPGISGNDFSEDDYNEGLKSLYFYMIYEGETEGTQALCGYDDSGIYYSWKAFTIDCEYMGKPAQSFNHMPSSDPNDSDGLYPLSDDTQPQWTVTLEDDISTIAGHEIIIRLSDILGNVEEIKTRFPSKDEQLFFEMTNSNNLITINSIISAQTKQKITSWKIIDSDNKIVAADNSKTFTYNSAKSYSIIWKYNGLWGEKKNIDKDLSSSVGNQTSIPEVRINDLDVHKSSTPGYLDCVVSLYKNDDPLNYYDPWDDYDIIKMVFDAPQNSSYSKDTFYFTKGEYSKIVSFPVSDIYYYQQNFDVKVYGLQNHVWSKSETAVSKKTINKISGETDPRFLELDNTNPAFVILNEGGAVLIKISENETGIKEATIRLLNGKNGGQGELLPLESDNTYELPVYKLLPSSTQSYDIEYTIADKAGNTINGKWNFFDSSYAKENDKIEFLTPTTQNGSVRIKESQSVVIGGYPLLYIYKYDNSNKCFPQIMTTSNYKGIISTSNESTTANDVLEKTYTIDITQLNKGESSYVKIAPCNNGGANNWFTPFICYNGAPGTGENDFLISNGTSTESVVVCSDKPVFVHTVVTSVPYEICKDWAYDEWEYYKLSLKEEILDFGAPTNSDPNANLPKRYKIPVGDMNAGDCYVVIAHFSDNHVEMSQVMQR